MSSIHKNMSIDEFAIFVASELKKEDINVVLVGGAVVSIYTKNKYQSFDLDFLSLSEHNDIRNVMIKLGFTETGKNFFHPNTYYHWDDQQSLEQALLVAKDHPINLEKIKKWSEKENSLEKFQIFLNNLKK